MPKTFWMSRVSRIGVNEHEHVRLRTLTVLNVMQRHAATDGGIEAETTGGTHEESEHDTQSSSYCQSSNGGLRVWVVRVLNPWWNAYYQ